MLDLVVLDLVVLDLVVFDLGDTLFVNKESSTSNQRRTQAIFSCRVLFLIGFLFCPATGINTFTRE